MTYIPLETRIRVSGLLSHEKAVMLARCMNRMVSGDLGSPTDLFVEGLLNPENVTGSWAVFIKPASVNAMS